MKKVSKDKGQRFMVVYRPDAQAEYYLVFGYCEWFEAARVMQEAIRRHPVWCDGRALDRREMWPRYCSECGELVHNAVFGASCLLCGKTPKWYCSGLEIRPEEEKGGDV